MHMHYCVFFFFNDTATTEIYTLSLHDALPISPMTCTSKGRIPRVRSEVSRTTANASGRMSSRVSPLASLSRNSSVFADRKSTRLNSSHANISYAVFCLKKKKKIHTNLVNSHNI